MTLGVVVMVEDRPEEERVEAALAETHPTMTRWLEPVYREHATSVLRTAYRVTGNVDDAEDVLQTVFLRLARREAPPEFTHGPLPYLRRAATNAALDIVQSRRVRSSSPLNAVPEELVSDRAPGPDRVQAGRELQDRLRDALGGLSRRHAEMFVLRYFEGLDNGEIAIQCDTSASTVAVTLHRVRARLAELLAPHMGGEQ
jgi:RNA polymerase sigma-70 factor (ECF subfamily)